MQQPLPSLARVVEPSPSSVHNTGPTLPNERSHVIDFWRGFVLCTIFINHIPGNLFEHLTYRNFGLSDSAEAFVFISGLSLALAYGRRFEPGRRRTVVARLGKRAFKLYGLHLALSFLGLAIYFTGALASGDWQLTQIHGRDLFFSDPVVATLGVLTLGHQLGYFNILPMYVVLVACVPAMLWLAARSRALLLVISLALYSLCRLTELNLPSWPIPGGWFFDPFAWQLAMALGVAAASARGTPIRPRRALVVASGLVLVVSAVLVNDGFSLLPGAWDWLRSWADLDKTHLGAGRIVHFLALAYVVWALRLGTWLRPSPVFALLAAIGRHGLAIFATVSLVTALDQVVANTLGHSLAVDGLLVGSGLVLLYAIARRLDLRRPVRLAPAALGKPAFAR